MLMLAYPLTKGLSASLFNKHVVDMDILESFDFLVSGSFLSVFFYPPGIMIICNFFVELMNYKVCFFNFF